MWKYDECAICGSKKELVPHHIIKCDSRNSQYFSLDNGIVMCHRCHNEYHRTYKEVNPYTLVKFSQKRYFKR